MRALVTGASGFVGRHLVCALRRENGDVLACGGPNDGDEYFPLDLNDGDTIRAALDVARPSVVFHLAAQAFVPESFASPISTYETNALGTARLAQAVRDYAAAGAAMPRIVFPSSAEVYGNRRPEDFPLRESLAPMPVTPYAASKAAAEALLLAEARSMGIDVVVARAFNHIGPGQSDRFAVAGFAAQLARIAQGAPPRMLVGNLDAARDVLDVRDVVEAYLVLAREGERAEIYNVCSGSAVTMRDLLGRLIAIAKVPVEVREDPARMRPADVPIFVGDAAKLSGQTGWKPRVPLERSLRDVYEAARSLEGTGSRGR